MIPPGGYCGRCGFDTVWRAGTTHVGKRSMSTSLWCTTCGRTTGSLVQPRDTLPPGKYTVRAEPAVFQPYSAADVEVSTGMLRPKDDPLDLTGMVQGKKRNVEVLMRDMTPEGGPVLLRELTREDGPATIRGMDAGPHTHEEVVEWCRANAGRIVRRKNGQTRYILHGMKMHHVHGWQLVLTRMYDNTRTWAPASEAWKFIIIDGKDAPMDGQDLSTPEEIIERLARSQSVETLEAALERRTEIEAKAAEAAARSEAEASRSRELREAAIAALEKAASKGDVGAANSLLDLTS